MTLDFRNDSFSPVSNRAVGAEGRLKRRGISLIDAAHFFGDNESAAQWPEKARWGDGPIIVYPHCHSAYTSRTTRSDSPYRCKDCRKHFSVRTGTVPAESRMPLGKWLTAAYQDLTNLKGVSSMKLSRDINTCQKTAWYMLRRLHKAYMSDEPPAEFLNGGNFQIDESFISGLEGNKHSEDRIKGSQGGATKMIVLCITHSASRKIWADVIPDTKLSTVKEIIERVVPPDGVIVTDDASQRGH